MSLLRVLSTSVSASEGQFFEKDSLMRLHVVFLLLISSIALIFASSAQAAVYGDYAGSTVVWEDVQDQNGLFGAPTASGDSLDFSPNAFEADCSSDPGCPPTPVTIDDTLTLTIQANEGSFIEDIVFSEAGDTTLESFVDALAASVVAATVFVDIFEIDGVSVNNISESIAMVFSQDGQYESTDEGYGTHLWDGSLTIDLDAIIADAGGTGRATRVQINLNNTLTAFAASGATSRIEKKDIDGLAITVVPEPGTALLFGLGLAGLAVAGRKEGWG
jgi:hypothetical protein